MVALGPVLGNGAHVKPDFLRVTFYREAQIIAVIRPLFLQKSKLNGKFGANENVPFSRFIKSHSVPSKSLGIASPLWLSHSQFISSDWRVAETEHKAFSYWLN